MSTPGLCQTRIPPRMMRSAGAAAAARQAVGSVVLVLAGLLGLWQNTSAQSAAALELTITLPANPLSLPLHVADAQGLFAQQGLQVKLNIVPTGQRSLEALFAGSAQLAAVSELPVMFASFERSDFAIVGTMATATRNIQLVARRRTVGKPADLAGKRVGVPARSSAQYFLDATLLFHGIDPREVKQVPLAPEALVPALAEGRIDAFAGYAPQGLRAMRVLGAEAVVLDPPRVYTEAFHLVAGRSLLGPRREELARVLVALARAEQFIAQRPEQARRILQQRLALEPADAEAILTLGQYRLGLDPSIVSTLEGQARWALREGHVKGRPELPNHLRFVEPGPLRAVMPAAFNR